MDPTLMDVYAVVNAAINSAAREIDNGKTTATLHDVLTEAAWCIAHWAENLEQFDSVCRKAKLELVKNDKEDL